jgi:uncharacterized membrane protein YidH (DUF202 family)
MTTGDNEQGRLDIDVRFLLANERTLLAWLRASTYVRADPYEVARALAALTGEDHPLASTASSMRGPPRESRVAE